MKTIHRKNHFFQGSFFVIARALMLVRILWFASGAQAQLGFDGGGSPAYLPLASWTFNTNWTSDQGIAPVSFANLAYSYLGNGASLVVNHSDPAWLNYKVIETGGTTNLTVDNGTVMFWFAPNSWASRSLGGIGPGVASRLLEVGGYTADSSLGWWSLYTDTDGNNLYFSTQTNDLSSNVTTYVSSPIAWTNNYFHQIALTYSATNTTLYLDGSPVASGAGVSLYPGPDGLTNGFWLGSDSTGNHQAQGMFNSLATYHQPLAADTIQQLFQRQYEFYMLSPWNQAMFQTATANAQNGMLFQPNFSANAFNIVAGAGLLQSQGTSASCFTSGNVWLANVAANLTSQPLSFSFDLAGGNGDAWYDVFVTSALANSGWVWQGEGQTCQRYALQPGSANAFFILGTPQDTDGDGLTDAYEMLVSHSNPNVVDTDGNGMPDGWQVLHFGAIKNNRLGDPDHDGLLNYQEYLYGTDPQTHDGFSIWVSAVN